MDTAGGQSAKTTKRHRLIERSHIQKLQRSSKGRSQSAIQQRLTYLNKPPEERRKEDMASFDNADMLEKAINQAADRICNRLDNIANALALICRDMESNAVGAGKHAAHTIKLLEEIKANGTLQQGTQQSIKHELQKAVYRRNMK